MDYRKLVDASILAGEIMLSGGAETYRVEDTLSRILKVSGVQNYDAIVTGNSIIVTISGKHVETITAARCLDTRSTDLGKVYRVNSVSRAFCSGELTLDEAFEELKQIKEHESYSTLMKYFGDIGTVVFFIVLLGGLKMDFLIASIDGIVVATCIALLKKINVNTFFVNAISAFFIAFTTMSIVNHFGVVIHRDIVISGAILPLVPGVAITNAIRDTLQNDYMSGGARAIEAFVMAVAIAVGIGVGLSVYPLL